MSFNYCPLQVYEATQHMVWREARRVVEWDRYGPAICRFFHLIPLDCLLHRRVVSTFDKNVDPSDEQCSRMEPNLTLDCHRIHKDVRFLVLEKNRLWKLWQPEIQRQSRLQSGAGKFVVTRRPSEFAAPTRPMVDRTAIPFTGYPLR